MYIYIYIYTPIMCVYVDIQLYIYIYIYVIRQNACTRACAEMDCWMDKHIGPAIPNI